VTALLPDLAIDLRTAFDRTFAAAPPVVGEAPDDYLRIRAGGIPYAISLGDIGGLFADRVVVTLPGPLGELLGVAAFRGATVPVYDLGALLGHEPAAEPRWLVLDTGAPPVAFAFEGLDGHLRVPAGAIAPTVEGLVRGSLRTPEGVCPVIDVDGVRAGVQVRVNQLNGGRP
jgi:chemotaxis signal transduction protein